MRQSLDHFYGNFRTVGMGGLFCIETGQARLHVMVSSISINHRSRMSIIQGLVVRKRG